MGQTFKELMAQAKAKKQEGGDYENLPPGKYTMSLTGCFRNKSKNERNQTNFDWEVAEGEMKGESHRSFHNLDHEVGCAIFMQDMEKFGVNVEGAESLEAFDQPLRDVQAMKPICAITVTVKNGYTNTRINEVLGKLEDSIPDTAETSLTVGSKIRYTHNG